MKQRSKTQAATTAQQPANKTIETSDNICAGICRICDRNASKLAITKLHLTCSAVDGEMRIVGLGRKEILHFLPSLQPGAFVQGNFNTGNLDGQTVSPAQRDGSFTLNHWCIHQL